MTYGQNATAQQNTYTHTFNQSGTYTVSVNYPNLGIDDVVINVYQPDIKVTPAERTICSGDFVVLNATGSVNINWTPSTGLSSDKGTSVVATPAANTTFTATGYDQYGCASTATAKISINNTCVSPPVSAGSTAQSYRIVSFPGKWADSRIETVLSEQIGRWGYRREKWRFLRNVNGKNTNIGDGLTTIDPGMGYWVLTTEPIAFSAPPVTGPAATLSSPFVLRLDKGWTQIGNPFSFDISWSDVLAQNGNPSGVGSLYVFESSFRTSDNLKAWGGGFVNSTSAITLNIPVKVKPYSGGRKSIETLRENAIDEESWFVPLKLSQGSLSNELGGVGMHRQAKAERDEFDENSLPAVADYLELNSYHPDYFLPKFMKDVAPLSSQYSWTFRVESSDGDTPISIHWDQSMLEASKAKLMLFDHAKNMLVDMKRAGSWELSSGQHQTITILFAREDTPLQVNNTLIGQPYPNPFDQRLSIPLVVGEGEGLINLSVYDSQGRLINSRGISFDTPGYHEITWEGRDFSGEQVTSGLYLVKISGNDRKGTWYKVMYRNK